MFNLFFNDNDNDIIKENIELKKYIKQFEIKYNNQYTQLDNCQKYCAELQKEIEKLKFNIR
jgi:hypothetical protein